MASLDLGKDLKKSQTRFKTRHVYFAVGIKT